MAKGRKTGGRDVKLGQVLNPKGRPPLPQDVNDARRLTKIEFIRVCEKYISMTETELNEKIRDTSTTVLELIVAKILQNAITYGDNTRLSFFLDRMIGKVTEKIQHTGLDDGPIRMVDEMTDEELDRRAKRIFSRLKDKFKLNDKD